MRSIRERTGGRWTAVLLWAGVVSFDTTAQLLFKSAAVRLPSPEPSLQWVLMVAQSARFWAAIACYAATFGFWMLILRGSRLSVAFPVTALSFIGVVFGSWLLFNETVEPVQYAGIALIVAGVALLRPLDG
jgi:multidrug transporter EmrE-like cation transporter